MLINEPGYNPNFPRKPNVDLGICLNLFPMPMFRTNNDINDHDRLIIFVESLLYDQIKEFILEKTCFLVT